MPDNLEFNIVANSQQARDEIKLVEAQVRSVRKEVRALAAEATKDPMALPKFRAANAELTKLEHTFTTLNKAIRGTGEAAKKTGHELEQAAHAGHAHGFYLVEQSVQSLSGAFQAVGHNIIGRPGAIGGFAVAIALEKLKGVLDGVSEAFAKVKAEAGAINVKPIQLQAGQRAVGKIGEDAEVATKAFQGLNAQLEDLRQNPPVPGQVPDPNDVSHPLRALGIERQVSQMLQSRAPIENIQDFALRSFVQQQRRFDPTQLNILSKNLFQQPSATMVEAAPALLKAQKERAELEKSAAGATKENLDAERQLSISKNKLAASMEDTSGSLKKTFRPLEIKINKWADQFLQESSFSKNLEDARQKLRKFFGGTSTSQEGQVIALPPVDVTAKGSPAIFRGSGRGPDDGHGPGSRPTQSVTPGLSDYQAALQQMVSPMASFSEAQVDATKASLTAADAVQALANAAYAASKSVSFDKLPPAATPADTFATGGYVHGPGSGTSDSILARLSAGEFVVNSARVRQVGVGFLQRLNGFADGGFVGRSLPHFAAGGLVPSGGGGRAVHLHLGSSSFALSGHDSVVDALVSAAHSQQMRSAGVKPSWFAARPGGQ